jgi:hypothetical protein
MPFVKKTWIIFFLLVSSALQANDLVTTVAKNYGLNEYKKIQEIRFTFHAGKFGLGVTRSWIWKPQYDSVISVTENIRYCRNNLDSSNEAIDAKFINDQYWLTFPLHLIWDKNVIVKTDDNFVTSPINEVQLKKIRVTYMKNVGYTPNDIYDLFISEEGLIKEWVYYKNGDLEEGRAFTWEKNETFSGLLISQEHIGPLNIKVWFSDIQVK